MKTQTENTQFSPIYSDILEERKLFPAMIIHLITQPFILTFESVSDFFKDIFYREQSRDRKKPKIDKEIYQVPWLVYFRVMVNRLKSVQEFFFLKKEANLFSIFFEVQKMYPERSFMSQGEALQFVKNILSTDEFFAEDIDVSDGKATYKKAVLVLYQIYGTPSAFWVRRDEKNHAHIHYLPVPSYFILEQGVKIVAFAEPLESKQEGSGNPD